MAGTLLPLDIVISGKGAETDPVGTLQHPDIEQKILSEGIGRVEPQIPNRRGPVYLVPVGIGQGKNLYTRRQKRKKRQLVT